MRKDNELGFMDSLRSGMAGAYTAPEKGAPAAFPDFFTAPLAGAMPVAGNDEDFVWEEPVFDVRSYEPARAKAAVAVPAPARTTEASPPPESPLPSVALEASSFTFEPVTAPPAPAEGDLPHFEWDKPFAPPARPAPEAPAARQAIATARAPAAREAATTDPLRARIRERYFAVRFPGAPAGAAAKDPSEFIKVARLYFEDEDAERAVELLQYAADALPGEERLWLARLEILFLSRRADAFVTDAREFQKRFPKTAAWPQVARLGFLLAPKEMVFAAGRPTGQSVDSHYGAWPESPNWIEAPWDLTGEVLAVELRGRILGTARPTVHA